MTLKIIYLQHVVDPVVGDLLLRLSVLRALNSRDPRPNYQ